MQQWIPIIIDVVALIIILGYIYNGYKNGFVYTVFYFIGAIASSVGSYFLSKFLAPILAGYTEGFWETWMLNHSLEVFGVEPSQGSSALQTAVPESVQLILEGIGEIIPNSVENVTAALIENMFIPLTTVVLECGLFLFLFLAFWFIWTRIIKGIRKIHLPIIGTVNALLGALFGVLQGGLVLMILTSIASIVVTVTGDEWEYLNLSIIRLTNLFYWFYSRNPFGIML